MYIYKTTNLIDKKIYIGKTQKNRKGYLGSGIYLKRAVKKYGKENFIIEIIEDGIIDKDLLCEREKYWIRFYDARNPKIGYNLTDGGDGFSGNHSEDTKKRLSILKIGGKHTQEHTDKIAAGNRGKVVSSEAKQKMSIAQLGENNSFYGKQHSEETKEKNSKAKIGVKKNRRDVTSKYTGVHWDNSREKWVSRIQKNKKVYFLGRFDNEDDAARVWNKKAIELGVPPERLNKIEGDN